MNIRNITVIIFFTISTFHSYSQSRVYHVGKNGKDNNPGTKISPFRTLGKVSEILNQGDSCIVHAGIYRERFRPKNNGIQNKPIVLMAGIGEKVIISGMEPISDWKENGNNIYKAKVAWTLGESNLVLINGTIGFEARFPNKTNSDPFDIQGGEIIEEGLSTRESEIHANPYRFLTEIIPEKWANEDLKDGKVWVLAQHKWGAWTAPVAGYNAKEKMLYFTKFGRDSLSVASNHNPNMMNKAYGRGIFYLFGSKVFLDAPNEWYFDKMTKELYIILPDFKKPVDGQVEFRKRTVAFDLQNKKFWKVSGFEIEGATIDLTNAENCTISHCKISYFWVSFPTQSASAMNDNNSGIVISGKNNVFQYSELAYSAGAGITLSGENNQVVNNLMHHFNYIGSIRAGAINMNGLSHQISHNTIHSVGRDCIKLGGANQTICYNNIYNPGLICEDVGVLYSGGTDYEMMQIHHNIIHNDNNLKKSALGIYFDNFTNNGIAHHNIVWGIKEGIRLNRPGNYHLIYNNIVVEINNAYGPWQGSDTQFGSAIVNNFTLNPIRANTEVFLANNVIGFPFDTQRLLFIKGKIMEGINKYGFPKYVGAFSDESDNWTAGHDFNRTSIPPISRELPFGRNYIENGSFEWQRNRSQMLVDKNRIDCWEKSGEVELNYSAGFNIPGPDTRNSVFGNSLLLKINGAGISQRVKGLKSDFPYKIGVYVQTGEAGTVILSVQSTQIQQSVSSDDFPAKAGWKLLVLSFRTGLKDAEATVQIRNIGKGNVYLDNIGLVPDLEKAGKEM